MILPVVRHLSNLAPNVRNHAMDSNYCLTYCGKLPRLLSERRMGKQCMCSPQTMLLSRGVSFNLSSAGDQAHAYARNS